jgi:hypothetical protein
LELEKIMKQKISKNNSIIKRSGMHQTPDRFIFYFKKRFLRKNTRSSLLLMFLLSCFLSSSFLSCDEPTIKLTRAERQAIDTLVNHQLDSISPILDSLCSVEREMFIKKAVDSIILERKEREKRLRLGE